MTRVAWPRTGSPQAAWACAALALLAAFFPLAYLVGSAFAERADSAEWLALWARGGLARELAQTAWVCAVAAVATLAVSAPQAVAVSLYRFRGAALVDMAALAPMLLAPYAAAGAWAGLDLGAWSHGPLPMALQIAFSCAPWSYLALRVAIARLPPALGEAAAAAGLARAARVRRIWLPLLAAPLAAAALFAAARAFGDYGTAERNGAHTFGIAFHELWNGSQSEGVAAAVALAGALPALLLTWATSGRARRHPPRQAAGATGAAPWRKPALPAPWAAALAAWTLLCLLAAFVVPEGQYVDWAIDGRWMGWPRALRVVGDALATSGAVALLLALAAAAATLLMRPGARGALPERLVWLLAVNLFVPPMALALAWLAATADGSLLASLLGPARDGKIPVLLAQAAKLAPFALLPALDLLSRENESLRDALRAAGLGPAAAARHLLRMAAPAIALGAAMAFLEAVKELEVAITLQHFGYQSPAIKIHQLARFHSEYAIASWVMVSQALMLPALLALGMWLRRLDARGAGIR